MSSKRFADSKSYNTAATLFLTSGLIFIILSVVSIIFLPIGIALSIISFSFWQHSKRLENNEHKDSTK